MQEGYSELMTKICTPPSRFQSQFKVAVVGCGNVGATAAYAMLLNGLPTELALIDHNKDRAHGLMLDFEHALSYLSATKITASNSYADCANAQVIFVTAGAKQAEGETRLDLIKKNRALFEEIIPHIAKAAPDAILVIVSNPVDVLTYTALKLSQFPRNRVFGSGTMLDTARLKFHISEKLCLNAHSVEAYVLGEHGDSSFPVFSSANVSGKPLLEFEGFDAKMAALCYEETKNAAYRIIHDIGFTCYSIGTVICEIARAIKQNARVVVPLSVLVDSYYGVSDVALSVPCVLDGSGVSETIEVPLNEQEIGQLKNSAKILKEYLA